MLAMLLVAAAIGAEPNPEQAKLLKTFRAEFVQITPGRGEFSEQFMMGDQGGTAAERPPHRVAIQHDFHIAKYEVPQNLWESLMGENPSRWKGARNSVEMVSHDEAVEFCRRATELLRSAQLIAGDETIRLPTEAEWEYAARAGTTTHYSFGDDPAQLDHYAWHTGNAAGNDPPVGAKKPNAWGLYDMHGYLWEWCADTWHDNYEGAPADGSAWTSKEERLNDTVVLRSGSWKDPASRLTSTFRLRAPKSLRDDAIGVRCVLSKAALKD